MATCFSEKYFIHQENSLKSAYLMQNKVELANNPRLKDQLFIKNLLDKSVKEDTFFL